MALIIFVFSCVFVWLLYEVWRAPMVKEESDDSITYLEEPKRFKDIFKRK